MKNKTIFIFSSIFLALLLIVISSTTFSVIGDDSTDLVVNNKGGYLSIGDKNFVASRPVYIGFAEERICPEEMNKEKWTTTLTIGEKNYDFHHLESQKIDAYDITCSISGCLESNEGKMEYANEDKWKVQCKVLFDFTNSFAIEKVEYLGENILKVYVKNDVEDNLDGGIHTELNSVMLKSDGKIFISPMMFKKGSHAYYIDTKNDILGTINVQMKAFFDIDNSGNKIRLIEGSQTEFKYVNKQVEEKTSNELVKAKKVLNPPIGINEGEVDEIMEYPRQTWLQKIFAWVAGLFA